MAADRPQLLTAKVDRLTAIIADAQSAKNDLLVGDARRYMSEAAAEVSEAGSVADVENVPLPSERS